MKKTLCLTYDEYWILWYGSSWLDNFFNSTAAYEFNPTALIEIDINKAFEAEREAHNRLTENDKLLKQFGSRERRFNFAAHFSLITKLQIGEKLIN